MTSRHDPGDSPAAPAGEPAIDAACPEYPEAVASLTGVLAWQRRHLPDRVVCHSVTRRRDGLEAIALTVDGLAARAARTATALARRGLAAGDRVILSLSDPHDFLVAFFAALAHGATPVPLPTAGEAGAPRSFAARVRGVCANCSPQIAIVEGASAFERAVAGLTGLPRIVEPGDLADEREEQRLSDRPGDTPAFVQYTSGSTGLPKGVLVSNRNLLANCRAIRDATHYTRADRMVSWLPLHHDMGLVGGLLTSVYCAAETWLMTPISFLARPVTWLEAITAYRATLTVAPTFAYSLCARKVPAKQLAGIDLSTLRLAYVGAEPVDPATVDAFATRYAPLGLAPTALYPVYGLAEATLAAAFPAPGEGPVRDHVDRARLARDAVAAPVGPDAPAAVTFVSVGRALPRHSVAIRSPETGALRGEREIGEIEVAGDSVTARYFEEPESTSRSTLRTGDLGYFANGRLFVVDRMKDLVIVAGQNFSPSDIELAAAEVAGVRRGRIVAFSRAGADGTEKLHVVAEIDLATRAAPTEVARAIAGRIRETIGLTPASVDLVSPGSLERTSSGKIQRRACAAAHEEGELRLVRTPAELASERRARRRARAAYLGSRTVREVLDWLRGTPAR